MRQLLRNVVLYFLRYYYMFTCKNVRIFPKARVLPKSILAGYNRIGRNTIFFGSIGHDSYIGKDSFLYAEIGNYCSLGDNVKCIFASHPVTEFVSTSPVFYSLLKQTGRTFAKQQLYKEVLLQPDSKIPLIINNDVWVGSDVTFVGTVKVSDGAVIAAGSVVTSDVSAYTIVGGVPAKEIKKRFKPEDIQMLLKIKWWDRDDQWIINNSVFFDNIEHLRSNVEIENHE